MALLYDLPLLPSSSFDSLRNDSSLSAVLLAQARKFIEYHSQQLDYWRKIEEQINNLNNTKQNNPTPTFSSPASSNSITSVSNSTPNASAAPTSSPITVSISTVTADKPKEASPFGPRILSKPIAQAPVSKPIEPAKPTPSSSPAPAGAAAAPTAAALNAALRSNRAGSGTKDTPAPLGSPTSFTSPKAAVSAVPEEMPKSFQGAFSLPGLANPKTNLQQSFKDKLEREQRERDASRDSGSGDDALVHVTMKRAKIGRGKRKKPNKTKKQLNYKAPKSPAVTANIRIEEPPAPAPVVDEHGNGYPHSYDNHGYLYANGNGHAPYNEYGTSVESHNSAVDFGNADEFEEPRPAYGIQPASPRISVGAAAAAAEHLQADWSSPSTRSRPNSMARSAATKVSWQPVSNNTTPLSSGEHPLRQRITSVERRPLQPIRGDDHDSSAATGFVSAAMSNASDSPPTILSPRTVAANAAAQSRPKFIGKFPAAPAMALGFVAPKLMSINGGSKDSEREEIVSDVVEVVTPAFHSHTRGSSTDSNVSSVSTASAGGAGSDKMSNNRLPAGAVALPFAFQAPRGPSPPPRVASPLPYSAAPATQQFEDSVDLASATATAQPVDLSPPPVASTLGLAIPGGRAKVPPPPLPKPAGSANAVAAAAANPLSPRDGTSPANKRVPPPPPPAGFGSPPATVVRPPFGPPPRIAGLIPPPAALGSNTNGNANSAVNSYGSGSYETAMDNGATGGGDWNVVSADAYVANNSENLYDPAFNSSSASASGDFAAAEPTPKRYVPVGAFAIPGGAAAGNSDELMARLKRREDAAASPTAAAGAQKKGFQKPADKPAVPPCAMCGCENFKANAFKKGCANCFHEHVK